VQNKIKNFLFLNILNKKVFSKIFSNLFKKSLNLII